MKKKFIKLQSIFLVFAMLMSMIIPAASIHASAAATHAIDICYEDGSSVTEQISLMESEQLQLTHKLLDCSMPDGAYLKWTSEAPLIVSVDETGKIYAHDSSKGAAVRLWIDNDVKTVAIIGPALAVAMEKLLFNDNIDLDTMDTEAILETVRNSLSGVSSTVADYLVKQLEKRLNSLDTGITVTLYSADGEVLASDLVRVLVTNSDKWYASLIPNGAFITNKESLPTTVAVGGKLKLEGGVTPLRLGYGVTWSIDTDSIWTSGSDYASMDENGNITFLKEGKVTVKVSPNANDLVDSLMKYINDAISLGNDVDTAQLAAIMIKLLGLNVSQNALKTVLDILVTVAKIGNNSSDLLATAIKTLSNYLLKASINDSITFTIVQSLELEKFELTAEKTELTEGDTAMVSLTNIVPAGANSQNVVWSSSDDSVISVNENGIVKARDAGGASSLNKKTATVTATVDGISASIDFIVKGKLITTPIDIGISGPTELEIGSSQQYSAVLYPERSNASITWGILGDDGETVNWASDGSASNSIAAITKDGILTGSDGGTVTLYAKAGLISKVISTYQVYVGKLAKGVQIDQGKFVSVHVPLYTTYNNAKTTLTATILPYDVTNKNVSWTVLSGNIEVTADGVVSPKGYSAAYGTVQVKTYDGGYTDTCTVSFANYPVTGVTLDKESLELTVGTGEQLTATVAPEGTLGVGDASIKDLIWTSSDTSVATVFNGNVIPVDTGEAIIAVTSVDGGFTAECKVTVSADKTALNYAISLVEKGDVTEENCSKEDWETLQAAYNVALQVRDTEVVSQSTCDKAAQNIIDIYNRIGAYVNVYGVSITLNGEDAPDFIPNKVELYQSYKGKTVQLGMKLYPENAMYSSIIWSSDSDKITVDQNGLVPNNHNSSGKAKITVTATDYTGNVVTDSVYVTFSNYLATGVSLSESELTAKVYQASSLKATVEPTGALGIAGASVKDVLWQSSNPDIVTVDEDGNLSFNAVGQAVIKVTTVDGGYTAECKITVITNKDSLAAAISAVTNAALVEDEYTVESYDALKNAYGKATELYNDENAAQADIDSITAALNNAFSSLKRLIKPEAVFIQYDDQDASEYISKEVNLTTSFKYQNNSIKLDSRISPLDSMYKTVEWTSSTSDIEINESGECSPTVNKACYGVITLTVTDERGRSVSDSVNVSFARYPVTQITVSPAEINDPLDAQPQKLSAKCQSETALITYDATIQDVIWSSDNPAAVSVDDNGQLTYNDAGVATITATSCDGGLTATCVVTVGGDKTALRAAILRADEANIDVQEYTYEASTEYTAAYDHAKEVEAGTVFSQEEIDAAAERLNNALDNLKPYIHLEKLNIYYNGETAPKFIAIKVPIYKTYTSQSVDLSYDYSPSNAMYKSISWSSDNEAVTVSESGRVSPAKNSACGACITLTATDHYGNTVENCVYVSFANNPVSSIELDKTSIEVAYGAEPQTLTATLKSDRLVGDKPSVSDVVWSTSDSDVATVDNGTVTFVEAGTCTITVSSVDGGYSATCTVTVKSDKTELTKTRAMMVGLALNSDDYTDESWAVFAAAMEKAENILLADNPKQRDINAANEELLNAYDSLVRYIRLEKIYITLDGNEAQEHISVNVPVTSKYTDRSVTFSYVLVPEDATINSVTWESSNSSVTVEDGVVKPAENKACYSIITVKATDYKGREFTDSVYVAFANVPVTGIKLDKTEISDAAVGGSDKITATVQPTGTLGIGAANITDVIWKSSDTSVVTVDGGNLSFVDTGSCTVTATTVDGGFTASVSIKVFADKSKLSAKAEEASQLKETDYTPTTWAELKTALDEAKKILEMGDPTQAAVNEALALLDSKIAALKDYVYVKGIDITYNNTVSDVCTVIVPEDQTYIMTTAQLGFKPEPENAMFVSSEWSFEGDIYVNINGIAVPKINTACYGKAIIKLTDDFGNVYTKEVTIVFAKNPAASISVTPSEVTTHIIGGEIQLTAAVLGADGNASDLDKVIWSSSDSSIASVDENGLVKIISGGTAIITAATVIGKLSATCVITVATDKTALQKAIYDAENPRHDEQDYTKETYAVFVEALKNAKAVYADKNVSQSEIDETTANLTSAIDALKKYIHMSAITIKHDGSDAPEFISVKVPVYKSYTSQSVSLSFGYSPTDAMYESIVWSSDSSLVAVDENGTVSPTENKACASKITVTATDHFGNKVTDSIYVSFANTPATSVSLDKSQISGIPGASEVLTATVEPKGKLGIGGANITNVIWRTSDPSVATVENGTVTFIDGGIATITVYTLDGGHSAQCTVTVTVSKDALLKAISDAEAIDLSLHTKESADALKNTIIAAKSVYDNASATSAQVSDAITKLKEATEALKYLDGDYTDVNSAIERYRTIDKSKYTEDSYNALKNAAEKVTYGLDITHQSEIDKMAQDINAAIASLVKIETAAINPIFDGTIVDNENMLIYGVEANIGSLDKYIEAVDGTIKYTETANGLGTGTIIELCNEDGNIIKTYKLVIFGDVNGDGLYDAQDAFIVDCIINGLLTEEKVGEAVLLAADCNHDGKINAEDRALLERAGLLLSKVDQSKSQQALETDEAYQEYTELINQSLDNSDNSVDKIFWQTDFFKTMVEFVLNFLSKIIIGMQ